MVRRRQGLGLGMFGISRETSPCVGSGVAALPYLEFLWSLLRQQADSCNECGGFGMVLEWSALAPGSNQFGPRLKDYSGSHTRRR